MPADWNHHVDEMEFVLAARRVVDLSGGSRREDGLMPQNEPVGNQIRIRHLGGAGRSHGAGTAEKQAIVASIGAAVSIEGEFIVASRQAEGQILCLLTAAIAPSRGCGFAVRPGGNRDYCEQLGRQEDESEQDA